MGKIICCSCLGLMAHSCSWYVASCFFLFIVTYLQSYSFLGVNIFVCMFYYGVSRFEFYVNLVTWRRMFDHMKC